MERILPITPIAAPRQNRNSRFNPKKKAVIERYIAWKTAVVYLAKQAGVDFSQDELHVVFILPMPKSWSPKKQRDFAGTPYKRERNDTDNLVKALKDAFWPKSSGGDGHIWRESQERRWGYEGKIVIQQEEKCV